MGKRKKKSGSSMASQADKYELYLKSVQEPEADIAFFERVFKKTYNRPARLLREDFCGTAAVCCQWVKGGPDRQAVGVDLDSEPLAWGRAHHLSQLSDEEQARVTLLQDDVRKVSGAKADVVAAQNFSFWIFKTRQELGQYFKAALDNLDQQGLLVLDMMGGYEVIQDDQEDVTRCKGFRYVWEQHRFDPITHDCTFFIHFRFKDGSELSRAFEYHWRLWTIPEVCELLREVGFSQANVYWEGTDSKTSQGNGRYKKRKHAPSEPAWITYIVGVK